jgi:aquaporin Z
LLILFLIFYKNNGDFDMKKFLAEFIGTFTLVLFGCGTAVIAGAEVGFLGIAFAFGFALTAMAYGIGPISGCHINPAVSIGVFVAGRMSFGDMILYIIAQFLGGIAAIGVLIALTSGQTEALGQNVYAEGNLIPAIVFEFVATFLFLIVILGSTYERKSSQASTQLAGIAIGIALVVIHIFGIPITGVSVNPARSLGPAIFTQGAALSQLWLFLVVPSVAGLLAGVLFRTKILEADDEKGTK